MIDEAFLQERRSIIGCSDIADVCNIEPYGCSLRLLYEKRNIRPDYEHSDAQKRAMKRGIKLENLIAEEYGDVTGRWVSPNPPAMVRHPQYPFIGVHMDRIVADWTGIGLEPTRNYRYLECKAPGYGRFRQVKAFGLPDDWILQVQGGILVAKQHHKLVGGAYAVMDVPNWRLIHFDVEPDPELQELILERCIEFWPKVENGPYPDKFPPTDKRCKTCEYRLRCHGNEILQVEQEESEKESRYEHAPEFQDLVNEALECQEIAAEAKKLSDEADQRLKESLISPRKILVSGAAANWYEYPEERWDLDGLNQYLEKYPSVKKLLGVFRKKQQKRTLRIFRC